MMIQILTKNLKRFCYPASQEEQTKDSKKIETTQDYHLIPLDELYKRLRTKPDAGLTASEARRRLTLYGPNRLSKINTVPKWIRFCSHLFGGFQLLLWLGSFLCIIAFLLQDKNSFSYHNLYLCIVLALTVIVTSIFCFYQESRSSSIIKSFLKMVPETAMVVRDGILSTIRAELLVVGDIVHIQTGNRIPADLRIISATFLKVDNSSLTGESEPQERSVELTSDDFLESKHLAFFSTNCVEGAGIGVVIASGDNTVMGRIAHLASSVATTETPLSRELRHFVHLIGAVALASGLFVFVSSILLKYSWLESIIYLIGITVANVPEGLLPTVTMCLTLVAQRMAAKNCLVKNLEAVETLGSTSVICSDKTGTLTQNRMSVSHLWLNGEIFNARRHNSKLRNDDNWKSLARVACLCSRAEFKPNQDHVSIEERQCFGDASEVAILKFLQNRIGDVAMYRANYPKVYEIPFSSTTKFHATFHEYENKILVCLKGAPEQVLERCSTIHSNGTELPITPLIETQFNNACNTLAQQGERVLAFCEGIIDFDKNYDFHKIGSKISLRDLRLLGLITMIDPPKPSVPDAVAKCRSAGIRVIMVTGDHPVTAAAIAKLVGIITDEEDPNDDFPSSTTFRRRNTHTGNKKSAVLTGQDLRFIEPLQLDQIISTYEELVFARITPHQKLLIVESYQRQGNVVAVTGDGVNDSPALKKADIGIAMGITGSDVSKHAADMILLDDNFASIVTGIEEGRLIFDNIRKSITYTLTSNVPEFTPFLAFIIAGVPLPLGTFAILLVDLGSDIVPAISYAYEVAENDIMKRQPRNPSKHKLVNGNLLTGAYAQIGVIEAFACFFTYFVVMAENGFWPMRLLGIRSEWDNQAINDLEDSYGQEWTFYQRKQLEYTCQTAFFVSIVVTQWANLIIRKTSKCSIIQHGMQNKALNFALVFETALAAFLCYCPGSGKVVKMFPLNINWWFPALPFSLLIFVYDEFRKLWIRYNPNGWLEQETYF